MSNQPGFVPLFPRQYIVEISKEDIDSRISKVRRLVNERKVYIIDTRTGIVLTSDEVFALSEQLKHIGLCIERRMTDVLSNL